MLSFLLFRKKRDQPPASPMQAPRPPLITISPKPLGLKTIADSSSDSTSKSNCVKRAFVASSRSSYLPPSSAEDLNGMGDEEAAEDAVEDEYEDNACWATYGRRRPGRRFPPPIPLLARTGNLTCHMPWVLKRIYKDDGRLVIQEVRVKHHEYFRARRRDGRLTLQLVELDDHQSNEDARAKEMTAVVGSDKKHDTTLSLLSSSSSSSSSLWSSSSLEEEKWVQKKNETRDCNTVLDKASNTTIDTMGLDVPRRSPRLAMSSKMMLSSSLPEPMCSEGSFEKGGPRSLHLQLPMISMRMVHG